MRPQHITDWHHTPFAQCPPNYSATLCALAACRNQSALGSAYNDAIVALYMSETTGRFSFSVGPTDKHTM